MGMNISRAWGWRFVRGRAIPSASSSHGPRRGRCRYHGHRQATADLYELDRRLDVARVDQRRVVSRLRFGTERGGADQHGEKDDAHGHSGPSQASLVG